MAILKDTTYKGLNIKSAYHRVLNVDVTKEKLIFNVEVCSSSDNTGIFFKRHSCVYDIEGANPIEQAYDFLKSLDEYQGCQDC